MLTSIRIRDFAIIDELEIDFSSGLTVITGETGAGKSIMIDAIGLVLGDRAEASTVRHGAIKAEIALSLEINQPELLQWLTQHDLDAGNSCILRRVITAEGRSRGYINGSPATVKMLRELGHQLVEIQGQHAHQALLDSVVQRKLLDTHGGLEIKVVELKQRYQTWQQASIDFNQAAQHHGERLSRIDLLQFQLTELDQLALLENELVTLDEDLTRLSHNERLRHILNMSLTRLYESESQSLYQQLSQIITEIQEASTLDSAFSESETLVQNALIQVEEASSSLRGLQHRLEADPQRLQWVEDRLAALHDMARKHHVKIDELPEKHLKICTELKTLSAPESSLEALQTRLTDSETQYDQLAGEISKIRRNAAKSLSTAITSTMQELGMEGGQLITELNPLDTHERKPWGKENVLFLISTNPGHPPKPLSKIASGGELSRISLAIQLAASHQQQLPTMFFDEVDSGIGGAIAEIVGKQLRTLGNSSQVFCVTHLPQVAACGHQHFQVQKVKSKSTTLTRLVELDETQRIEEIARMLGGQTITRQTMAHAAEMLDLGTNRQRPT